EPIAVRFKDNKRDNYIQAIATAFLTAKINSPAPLSWRKGAQKASQPEGAPLFRKAESERHKCLSFDTFLWHSKEKWMKKSFLGKQEDNHKLIFFAEYLAKKYRLMNNFCIFASSIIDRKENNCEFTIEYLFK
ncbi:MAG: hypothetical protein MJZ76_09980, partial [Bacteroidales bacterium]|nr:hypothetical protein [Bacteroidales bacterium]